MFWRVRPFSSEKVMRIPLQILTRGNGQGWRQVPNDYLGEIFPHQRAGSKFSGGVEGKLAFTVH
jgi:hypothetical protein